VFLQEKLFFKRYIAEKAKLNGLKVGRLTILFERDTISLYWDTMKLTRGQGFGSRVLLQDALGSLRQEQWNFEKVSERTLKLTRRHESLCLDEIWEFTALDEKQIDWDIALSVTSEVEVREGKCALISSTKYHTWIDAWGEGKFYPVHNYEPAELRYPKSECIGLRGRKKLRGQLPTLLLDFAHNIYTLTPVIKNSETVMGARVLSARIQRSNGKMKLVPGLHKFCRARIKIVEEDFTKRKKKR
jgi:hypothetical protein